MDESSKETSGERQSQEPEAAKLTNETGDTPETSGGETPAGAKATDASSAGAKPAAVPALSGKQTPPATLRGAVTDSALPMVWSPNLGDADAGAEEILESPDSEHLDTDAEAAADEEAAATAKAASPQRSVRIALVAVALAGAAAIGSFIGSLSATGVEHFWPATTASTPTPVRTVAVGKGETSELQALKTNLEAAARGANGQLAKLTERLERLERGQAEPNAKIARVAEALDRLEKKNAAAAASAAAAPETTGSIPSTGPSTAEAKASEKVLPDWIVREAHGGRALVENRFGGMFDIAIGSVLPGLGRVESVKKQDGQWVVVTARGVIFSAP
jgi:hypothetical protein